MREVFWVQPTHPHFELSQRGGAHARSRRRWEGWREEGRRAGGLEGRGKMAHQQQSRRSRWEPSRTRSFVGNFRVGGRLRRPGGEGGRRAMKTRVMMKRLPGFSWGTRASVWVASLAVAWWRLDTGGHRRPGERASLPPPPPPTSDLCRPSG